MKLPLINQDKANHIVYGFVIYFIANLLLNAFSSLGVVLLFALGKEARPDANIAQIFYYIKKTAAPIDDAYVKKIPVVRPVEMIKALKEATELPKIALVKEIQLKSGG